MASDRDLHRPSAAPVAAAVVLHPHPSMGGDRHHPLVVAVAEGLAAADVVALRIDLRDPDPTRAAAMLTEVAEQLAGDSGVEAIHLVGYSWGSVVSSLATPAGLAGRVLVAPPVSMLDGVTIGDDRPALVLVPAHDQFGGPDAVAALWGARPDTQIETVEGCDHFLAGALARIASRTVTWCRSSP